jgi:glucose-1-phosphatase
MAERGTVDETMLAEVDGLRSRGHVVAVLTNGTDTIAEEMLSLGLDVRFDAIFNSADIGVAKPDRRAFEKVCAALDVDPARVFFTDDTESKLSGAIEVGMTARLFVGVEPFRRHLAEVGLGGA